MWHNLLIYLLKYINVLKFQNLLKTKKETLSDF